jgi:hypothetical protein
MLAARQSPEVPVKHHQQPAAPVILKAMDLAFDVPQLELDRRLVFAIRTGRWHESFLSQWHSRLSRKSGG